MTIIIICIFLFLLTVFFFSYIKVEFNFEENYIIKIKYALFTLYSSENAAKKKLIDTKTDKEENNDKFKFELGRINLLISKIKKVLTLLSKTLKKRLIIKELNIKYSFGFNDAAVTGMYSGVAYSIIYSLVGYIDSSYTLKKHTVSITPDFDNEHQTFNIKLCAKIKLYHLLIFGIKTIRIWIK